MKCSLIATKHQADYARMSAQAEMAHCLRRVTVKKPRRKPRFVPAERVRWFAVPRLAPKPSDDHKARQDETAMRLEFALLRQRLGPA